MLPSSFTHIVAFVGAHKLATMLILFASMVVEGESFLIIGGVLIHLGALSLWEVGFISLIGVLVGDFFWYFLGTYLRKINWAERYIITAESVVHRLLPKFKERPFLSLVLAKYVYGTNHATLVLSGVIGMNIWLFTKAEVVATVIWVAVFITLGYLFGSAALLVSHRVSIFLLIVLVLILAFMAIQRFVVFYYESKNKIK